MHFQIIQFSSRLESLIMANDDAMMKAFDINMLLMIRMMMNRFDLLRFCYCMKLSARTGRSETFDRIFRKAFKFY